MKPILFNIDMVRAILDGRKTVTRRVIKDVTGRKLLGMCVDGDKKDIGKIGFGTHESGVNIVYKKPPYQVGDVLYVRETFAQVAKYTFWYRATPPKGCENILWGPSIHMPKEAARIFLKVTDVRVERLQDMDYMDAIYEGIDVPIDPETGYPAYNPLDDFTNLWDSTIKKEDLQLYSWDKNPYVWVIEFDRCKKPESEGI